MKPKTLDRTLKGDDAMAVEREALDVCERHFRHPYTWSVQVTEGKRGGVECHLVASELEPPEDS